MSMFRSMCYVAGSFVVMGLLTSPLYAMPSKTDKKNSYKVEQVKKGKKGKKKKQP